jgi:hypothetical protein
MASENTMETNLRQQFEKMLEDDLNNRPINIVDCLLYHDHFMKHYDNACQEYQKMKKVIDPIYSRILKKYDELGPSGKGTVSMKVGYIKFDYEDQLMKMIMKIGGNSSYHKSACDDDGFCDIFITVKFL